VNISTSFSLFPGDGTMFVFIRKQLIIYVQMSKQIQGNIELLATQKSHYTVQYAVDFFKFSFSRGAYQ